MNPVCKQTHSTELVVAGDLVLVGLDGKFCVHYQLSTYHFYAYRDGKPIGGGDTLRMASEICNHELRADDDV